MTELNGTAPQLIARVGHRHRTVIRPVHPDRMHVRRPRAALLILAIAAALVAACTGSRGAPSVEAVTPGRSVAPSVAVVPSRSAASSAAPGVASGSPSARIVTLDQAWAVAQLIDASTGETFRIADYAGKVVLVETMAIWCSSCLAQQRDVQSAMARLPADSVVFVVLDVDPNEDAASLAAYREQHGFQGRYAIAGKDVGRALAGEFGDQFLNPPSTPMVVIGTDGTVTRTKFGHKSLDEIVDLAGAHGA